MVRSGEDNVYETEIWDRAALSQCVVNAELWVLLEKTGLQRSGDEHGPGKVESISSFLAAVTRS